MALAILLGSAALAGAAPPAGNASFKTSIPIAILIDSKSNSVLFQKNADQQFAPASLAKLMTLEFLFHRIKKGKLKLDQPFRITLNAWRNGGAPSHGTTMFAALHSEVSLGDLIRGIVVDSANDACMAIAQALAGGEAGFGAMLTQRARAIGLRHSTFVNSTGYSDPNEQVTARDMAELARDIILTYPNFYSYFSQRAFLWNKIRQTNRNPLFGMGLGADGLKTGKTDDGLFNLIGSAVEDNERLIIVIAGAKSAKERAEEARRLLDWGFQNFRLRTLFAAGQNIGAAEVFNGSQAYVPLVGPKAVQLMVPRYDDEPINARVDYTGPVPAPVHRGQAIGTLKVWRGSKLALRVQLAAAKSVGRGTMTQRALDGASELLYRLFWAGVNRLDSLYHSSGHKTTGGGEEESAAR
jgi:D-alanyl-D-alanine carboxypeptidase (penicillin-binding protein 5/6)